MSDKGRVSSILSAAAVVLSLAFVGYELRQNTAMMRGATMQSMSDTYVNVVSTAAQDPKVAELFRRIQEGGETTADLAEDENTQISMYINAFVQMLENSYLQHREGLVSDVVFESYGWRWGLIQTPRFREWWDDSSRRVVSSEFATFFEERVQIGPD